MSSINVNKSTFDALFENKCKICNEEPFSQCPDNPCKYRRQLPPPISSISSLKNPTDENSFDYDRIIKHSQIFANNDSHELLLRYSCIYGCPDLVKLLLDNGVNPRAQHDSSQESAIFNAMLYGNCTHVIDILIQYGCDINELIFEYKKSYNYLYFAIKENKLKMVKHLLHLGLDPNSPFGSIHVYHFLDNLDILKLMLSHGANIENMTEGKTTLASYIIKNTRQFNKTEFERLFQLLVKCVGLERCDKYEYSISGRSLMHLAIYRNNIYYVDYLLEHGLDLNCRELSKNKTVLHIAASTSSDLTKSLLKYGAMVDAIDCDGNTALHLAIKNSKYQDIRDLLLFGARFNIANCVGKTAVDLAIDCDDEKSIEWMLLFGAKVEEIERLLDANSDIFLTKIREMLVRYEMKIKILKGNQDLNVGIDVELNKFKDECMKELDLMKNSKILDKKLNCLDLLFAGNRKLIKLASESNENEMMSFYNNYVCEKLPIYKNLIWKNINVGYTYEPVYEKAFESLNNIFDSKLPILIVEDVMNYLNYQDIKNLIECFPQLL